jgi:hypothetical protein
VKAVLLPEPDRLRTVLGAVLAIAGAIGAEWLLVHFTGALQRPAPLAAAGAAASARVVAANRGVLIFAMVLGGVVGHPLHRMTVPSRTAQSLRGKSSTCFLVMLSRIPSLTPATALIGMVTSLRPQRCPSWSSTWVTCWLP